MSKIRPFQVFLSQHSVQRAIKVLLILWVLYQVGSAYWLCDDAMITWRHIKVWLAGYGPNYNIYERVQAYTHPLWLLSLALWVKVSGSYYWATVFLSLSLVCVALITLARYARDAWVFAVAVLMWVLSKNLINFSSSGLENPLTHLLMIVFFVELTDAFTNSQIARKTWRLYLLLSLAYLTRPDAALIMTPALVWATMRQVRRGCWSEIKKSFLAVTPLLLWGVFSLVYYGLLFPNTFYVKQFSGVPRFLVIAQGWNYFYSNIYYDPMWFLLWVFMFVTAFCYKDKNIFLLWLGLSLHGAYLLLLGGDFMYGRFLSPWTVLGVCVWVHSVRRNKPVSGALITPKAFAIALIVLMVIATCVSSLPEIQNRLSFAASRINDEPKYLGPVTNISVSCGKTDEQVYQSIARKWQRRHKFWYKEVSGDVPVVELFTAGFNAFIQPLNYHVLDRMALGDPLLSHLAINRIRRFTAGHVRRPRPPMGYIASLSADKNMIEDPALRVFYDDIRSITRGSLWTRERWYAILKVNYNLIWKGPIKIDE